MKYLVDSRLHLITLFIPHCQFEFVNSLLYYIQPAAYMPVLLIKKLVIIRLFSMQPYAGCFIDIMFITTGHLIVSCFNNWNIYSRLRRSTSSTSSCVLLCRGAPWTVAQFNGYCFQLLCSRFIEMNRYCFLTASRSSVWAIASSFCPGARVENFHQNLGGVVFRK